MVVVIGTRHGDGLADICLLALTGDCDCSLDGIEVGVVGVVGVHFF